MAESQPPAIEPDLLDSASSPQELRQRILNGFQGTIEPVQVGAGYKFGIAAVAFVMILLPLLAALLALWGWQLRITEYRR